LGKTSFFKYPSLDNVAFLDKLNIWKYEMEIQDLTKHFFDANIFLEVGRHNPKLIHCYNQPVIMFFTTKVGRIVGRVHVTNVFTSFFSP
jgi:hypothetical protein